MNEPRVLRYRFRRVVTLPMPTVEFLRLEDEAKRMGPYSWERLAERATVVEISVVDVETYGWWQARLKDIDETETAHFVVLPRAEETDTRTERLKAPEPAAEAPVRHVVRSVSKAHRLVTPQQVYEETTRRYGE